MDYAVTTTASTIDGCWIKGNLVTVRGIVVRSRSIVGSFGAFLETIVSGNTMTYTQLCKKTRAKAYDVMLAHATEMGANAMVGVRYDVTEVMCHGTAVNVEPLSG